MFIKKDKLLASLFKKFSINSKFSSFFENISLADIFFLKFSKYKASNPFPEIKFSMSRFGTKVLCKTLISSLIP